ncbi:PLP-dependent aminotransferase family protein [Allomesorhizobium alhagi]|uniref:GntR family transcriptional regulator with aminotransferase domain n=1 Tax=Mesorhizobium alhagi CCNWXJ12-2 TaxID=1107882 RepID=H0HYF3_9HYPH|nr:PLP-dependent aminotransferase family protein [Mesorhizobium alhagi]EHK54291.1 GntR family transcriptional regulator with aminotransferase domain [Mesorhizobium alhagi CCNWXJ12-2]
MFERTQFKTGEVPIYRQIADLIAEKIADGGLAAGDRLPPQRDIARMAGVNLTTVTRAFAALQEQGLVQSRPGRGSIIADPSVTASFKSAPLDEQGFIDLSVNRPATTGYLQALATLMPQLPSDPRYAALQDFHAPEGPAWAREAMAAWLAPTSGVSEPSRIIMTNGAQHGLACVLGALARQGDTILADAVTYQGIGALCRSLDLSLKPVAMDRGGMRPAALEAMCAEHRPRAVFLVPTLHNPTTITLDAERRRALADIARNHRALIIEDDVYRPLKVNPPAAFIASDPDITVHIGGLSKCVAPGLRLGAVLAPKAMVADIAAMLRINCWSTSPLNALIATRMIEDGLVARVIAGQREEFARRQAQVREVLADFDVMTDDAATHAWLQLPEPWHGNSFVRAASVNGVGVLSGEAFAVDRDSVPHAVRINVGAARSRDDLARALQGLRAILSGDRRLFDAMI